MALYSLQRYILQRERLWLLIWFVLAIIWFFVSLVEFAKSHIVNMVASNAIVLVLSLRLKNKRLPILQSAIGIISVLLLVRFVYQVLGATESFNEAIRLIIERYIAIPMVTTYRHFVVFPDIFTFLYWSNSRTLNLFLGFGQFTSTGEASSYQIASSILMGHAFNMNTGFLGAGWAEFGYLGIAQSALLIFGSLLCWDIYFCKSRVKIPMPALLAFFLGKIWNIHNGDMMFMLLPGGIILGPAVYSLLFSKERRVFQALPDRNHKNLLPVQIGKLKPVASRLSADRQCHMRSLSCSDDPIQLDPGLRDQGK